MGYPLDTLKHEDSLIAFKKGVIAIQQHSINAQKHVLDSLSNSIKVKQTIINAQNATGWGKFFAFLHDLRVLMISKETLVFVIGCAIMGLIIISADWITFLAVKGERRKSLFTLKYTKWDKIFFNYLLWGIGSGLLAYIASAIGMFKCSITSCVVIAVTWPGLLPKIIEKLSKEEEDKLQQPN